MVNNVRLIDEKLISNVVNEAKNSSRKRAIYRFHEHSDLVQRMINAIEPESYIPPHKHQNPDKPEVFLILKGKVAIVFFDDEGQVVQTEILDEKGPVDGVDIAPDTWHMPVSLKENSVVFEVTQGPYEETTHKKFAPWAPAEENRQAGQNYLQQVRGTI